MALSVIFRNMLADLQAEEEAAQNSGGDVNSYTNHRDGSQNINGRKSNSGENNTFLNYTFLVLILLIKVFLFPPCYKSTFQ